MSFSNKYNIILLRCNIVKICIIVFILLPQQACITPKQLAKKFVLEKILPNVLFFSDPNILTDFYRADIDTAKSAYYMPEKISYMLNDTNLRLIKQLYDSTFIEETLKYGFCLFGKDSVSQFFLAEAEQKWKLSIVQISFEEHRIMYEDKIRFMDYSVVFDTIVSEFQLNTWYELTPVNDDSLFTPFLLFASVNVYDIIRGRFQYNWKTRMYEYNYDLFEVTIDDIFNLSATAAIMHSNFLFDFFLNRYVYYNIKKPQKIKIYYSYDRFSKKIVPARNNRFIFM